MPKYKVQVVRSYWNTIEIEADNLKEAGDTAFDMFDIRHATEGDAEVHSIEEIQNERY
jgi:hypothetical protein